jgi:hypothetical protein
MNRQIGQQEHFLVEKERVEIDPPKLEQPERSGSRW